MSEYPASIYLRDAIGELNSSMESERSFMRRACLIGAAQSLQRAGHPEHAERALTLSGIFWGDGRGVDRLYEELCALVEDVSA